MDLIAISVLFLVFVLSFTLAFSRDRCMHLNKAMLLWGDQSDIYAAERRKGPHSHDTMQILPQKSHFGYSQFLFSSFCISLIFIPTQESQMLSYKSGLLLLIAIRSIWSLICLEIYLKVDLNLRNLANQNLNLKCSGAKLVALKNDSQSCPL